MILGRHSGLLFASTFVTGGTAALWGIALASIGSPDTVALADDRTAALALTGLSAGLWGFHWLRERGLAQLADAIGDRWTVSLLDRLLSQRAQKSQAKKTQPLRMVR